MQLECEVVDAEGDGGVSPTVSVVIPTRARPERVLEAVRSAMAQTLQPSEIIVVIDGPDPATRHALDALGEATVVVIQQEETLGASKARNAGILASRGHYIALLDDDDAWRPDHLAVSIAKVDEFGADAVFGRAEVRTSRSVDCWPTKAFDGGRIDEFLFCRSRIRQGEGFAQTSSYVFRATPLRGLLFEPSVKAHQDWDLLIRAESVGLRIVFNPEATSVWNMPEGRPSMSANAKMENSLEWFRQRRSLMSRRAAGGFLFTTFVGSASKSLNRRTILRHLASEARGTRPSASDLLRSLLFLLHTRRIPSTRSESMVDDAYAIHQIVTQYERGGAQSAVMQLEYRFHDVGIKTQSVAVYDKYPDQESDWRPHILSRRRPDPLRATREIYRFLRRTRPADVTLAHTHYAIVLAGLAGLAARRPIVAVHHSAREIWPAALRWAYALLRAVGAFETEVCVSESVRVSMDIANAHVIENSSALPFTALSKAEARALYEMPDNATILVAVGRLAKEKNHRMLVNALRATDSSIHLYLAGDGPLRQEIVKEASGLNIHLLGSLSPDRVATLLRAADVFVFPSLAEGAPIALLEAIREPGLPILASDIPPHQGLLPRECLLPANSPSCWTRAIESGEWRTPRRVPGVLGNDKRGWDEVAAEYVALVRHR